MNSSEKLNQVAEQVASFRNCTIKYFLSYKQWTYQFPHWLGNDNIISVMSVIFVSLYSASCNPICHLQPMSYHFCIISNYFIFVRVAVDGWQSILGHHVLTHSQFKEENPPTSLFEGSVEAGEPACGHGDNSKQTVNKAQDRIRLPGALRQK